MRHAAWWAVVLAAMAGGCGPDPSPGPGPGPSTLQTCAQMGWRCGVDDYGASCGSCGTGTACNGAGSCIATGPGCSCAGVPCGGSNGCGSTCAGSCPSGQACSAGNVCMSTSTVPRNVASGETPLFPNFYAVPFTVATASTVGYSATSAGGDTFSAGIFSAVDWAIYSNRGTGARAYGLRENTSMASGNGAVPAGNYVLGFYCTNLVERCAVTYAIAASP